MLFPTERDLVRVAVGVLQRRVRQAEGYAGLTPAAARGLCRTLNDVCDDAAEMDLLARRPTVCLAHRIVDDDHPQCSPLWPAGSNERESAS